MMLLVVFNSVIVVVAAVSVGGIHRPLLGVTRSTMSTNIFAIVNDTTKDIIKIVSILCFYFVIFFLF